MMIPDMIREAATEHEIHFLLTSYVEAVQYGNETDKLPLPLRALPLQGRGDIEARVTALGGELYLALPQSDEDAEYVGLVGEALSVFATALLKLRRMEAMQSGVEHRF